MNSRTITAALTVIVAVLAATAAAQEAKQHTQGGEQQVRPEQPRKTAEFHGVVQEVDLKNGIVMAGKPKSELATAFHASKVKLVGYQKLSDIKAGDKVKIEYDAIKSKTVAMTITKE